jgi:8-oxo-dGTP pyrophosphatase MutT (NUDIX family)
MNSLFKQLQSFFEVYKRAELTHSGLTCAGVLVPIFEKNGDPHFLLTKRTQDVEHHKGQVSFPGGAVDSRDRNIVATALRETEEEIGLMSDRVKIIGVFDDITIPTGFLVTPVIGYISSIPILKLSATEVESVIEVPFSFFLEPKNKEVVKMMHGGEIRDVYSFTFGEYKIWGGTAFIIDSLLNKLVTRT